MMSLPCRAERLKRKGRTDRSWMTTVAETWQEHNGVNTMTGG